MIKKSTLEEVISKVNDFLINEIEIEETLLKENALLKEDLGIDSLDFVDIVVIVEKHFGFEKKENLLPSNESIVGKMIAERGYDNLPDEYAEQGKNELIKLLGWEEELKQLIAKRESKKHLGIDKDIFINLSDESENT